MKLKRTSCSVQRRGLLQQPVGYKRRGAFAMAYPLVANLCDQGFYRRPARQRLDGFVRRRSAVSHLLRFTTTARAIWPSRLVHPNWHVAVHQNELVFTERILKQFELLLLTLLQESAGFLLRLLGRIFADVGQRGSFYSTKISRRKS